MRKLNISGSITTVPFNILNEQQSFYQELYRSELWRYTSQLRAQVNLESRADLESTTSQVNFLKILSRKYI